MDCPSSVARPRWGSLRARRGCLLLILVLASAAATGAPKTDIVVFHNGDRLTGEVKGLDRGELSFETDAAGTLSIEWARLVSVDSRQILQVELTSGLRYTGRSVAEDSNRFDVTANARRFLANRLFYQGSLSFDGNDELGLELAEAGRWIEVLVGERGAQSSHDCWSGLVAAGNHYHPQRKAPLRNKAPRRRNPGGRRERLHGMWLTRRWLSRLRRNVDEIVALEYSAIIVRPAFGILHAARCHLRAARGQRCDDRPKGQCLAGRRGRLWRDCGLLLCRR